MIGWLLIKFLEDKQGNKELKKLKMELVFM